MEWDGEGGIGECVGGPSEKGGDGKWEGEGVGLLRKSAVYTKERGIRYVGLSKHLRLYALSSVLISVPFHPLSHCTDVGAARS